MFYLGHYKFLMPDLKSTPSPIACNSCAHFKDIYDTIIGPAILNNLNGLFVWFHELPRVEKTGRVDLV